MSERAYYTYIITNPRHTVLYTGMTGDLDNRIRDHKSKKIKGFASKYNCVKLVHAEAYPTAMEAILREKQIKAGSRQKKINVINKHNPEWSDLWEVSLDGLNS